MKKGGVLTMLVGGTGMLWSLFAGEKMQPGVQDAVEWLAPAFLDGWSLPALALLLVLFMLGVSALWAAQAFAVERNGARLALFGIAGLETAAALAVFAPQPGFVMDGTVLLLVSIGLAGIPLAIALGGNSAGRGVAGYTVFVGAFVGVCGGDLLLAGLLTLALAVVLGAALLAARQHECVAAADGAAWARQKKAA